MIVQRRNYLLGACVRGPVNSTVIILKKNVLLLQLIAATFQHFKHCRYNKCQFPEVPLTDELTGSSLFRRYISHLLTRTHDFPLPKPNTISFVRAYRFVIISLTQIFPNWWRPWFTFGIKTEWICTGNFTVRNDKSPDKSWSSADVYSFSEFNGFRQLSYICTQIHNYYWHMSILSWYHVGFLDGCVGSSVEVLCIKTLQFLIFI